MYKGKISLTLKIGWKRLACMNMKPWGAITLGLIGIPMESSTIGFTMLPATRTGFYNSPTVKWKFLTLTSYIMLQSEFTIEEILIEDQIMSPSSNFWTVLLIKQTLEKWSWIARIKRKWVNLCMYYGKNWKDYNLTWKLWKDYG